MPHDTTWWTTNDATLEIKRIQLEVGSVATDFEHRSFGNARASLVNVRDIAMVFTGKINLTLGGTGLQWYHLTL